VDCEKCNRSIASNRYAPHLEKCLINKNRSNSKKDRARDIGKSRPRTKKYDKNDSDKRDGFDSDKDDNMDEELVSQGSVYQDLDDLMPGMPNDSSFGHNHEITVKHENLSFEKSNSMDFDTLSDLNATPSSVVGLEFDFF
jgi:hypothetical protein